MKKVDRLRKRAEFLASRAKGMPKLAFRARASTVALLEQDEVRRASGRLGRTAVYDDLLVPTVSTDLGDLDRVDVPKAPSQKKDGKAATDAEQDRSDEERDPQYPVSNRGSDDDADGDGGLDTSIWSDDRTDDDEE